MATDLQELQLQFNYLTSQIEEGKRQLTEVQLVLSEIQETMEALKQLQSAKNGTLVSLGSSTFARANLNATNVITPIAANVYTEKPPQEAAAFLEERLVKLSSTYSNMEKTLNNLLQMRQQIVTAAQASQKA